MFRKKFEQHLNKKSKSDYASIEPFINKEIEAAPKRQFPFVALIPAGAFVLAVAIALPIALPRFLQSKDVATTVFVDGDIKELTAPKKPFNERATPSNENYLQSLTTFSAKLGSYAAEEGENFVASPLSIATAFSMVYEGADKDTKQELANLLAYDGSFEAKDAIHNMLLATSIDYKDKEGQRAFLDVSDALFVDDRYRDKMKKDYLDTLEKDYFAESYAGELKSEKMHELLATWINDKTNDFFGLKGEDFKQMEGVSWLVNSIYLKAAWISSFQELPSPKEFHNETGTTSSRKYLNSFVEDSYGYATDSFLVGDIGLDGGLRLRIIDKKESCEDPFSPDASFADKEQFYYQALLNPEQYLQNNKKTEREDYNISIEIPSFKVTSSINLLELFKVKGELNKSITPYVADFSPMAEGALENGLHMSKAIHSAGIDLNKDGIEAAAYTIVEMKDESIGAYKLMDLKLDHPFHYAILDRYEHPLFIGRVADLSK
ncbi:MAG: hypothetical protein IJS52_09615 [Bacilli bacterium]|nr:hypothetical protein [Bacilli bacterium]